MAPLLSPPPVIQPIDVWTVMTKHETAAESIMSKEVLIKSFDRLRDCPSMLEAGDEW